MRERLNGFHISILIFMIESGVMSFSLPRVVSEEFGTNGWMALGFCYAISLCNIALIWAVYKMGKGENVFDLLERTFPRFLLFPFYFGLAAVWAIFGCTVGKQYILIFQMIAFPTTNPMVFKFIMDVLIFFLLIKGIYNICKASTVFFYLTIWIVPLFLALWENFKVLRLTPFIFQGTGAPVTITGIAQVYTAFLGYEICMLLFPYVSRKTKLMRAVFIGNTAAMLFYLFICLLANGMYSFAQLKRLMFPVLEMLSYIEFPFMERIENLLYSFFLFKILITTTLYFWAAAEALKRIFPKNRWHFVELGLVIVTYYIATFPSLLRHTEIWLRNLAWAEIGLSFGMPLLLIVLLMFKGGKRADNAADADQTKSGDREQQEQEQGQEQEQEQEQGQEQVQEQVQGQGKAQERGGDDGEATQQGFGGPQPQPSI